MLSVRRIATSYYGRNRIHAADVCAASLAPLLAIALRDPTLFRGDALEAIGIYVSLSLAFTLIMFSYFRLGEGLTRFFSMADAVQIGKASVLSVAATAVCAFVFTRLDSIPRSVPVIHLLILGAIMLCGRLLRREMYRLTAQRAVWTAAPVDNLLVVGTNRLAWFYLGFLANFGHGRQRVVGLLDDKPGAYGRTLHGIPVLGSCEALDRVVEQTALHGIVVNRVVVSLHEVVEGTELWNELSRTCKARSIALEYLPERLGLFDRAAEVAPFGPAALSSSAALGVRVSMFWAWKRVFDIVAASVGLVVASPIFLLISLAVYLEAGAPVVFWQLRLGRDRRPLFVYKFRTFRTLYTRSGEITAETSRLTMLGRILRATRLDELPQLLNVLKGEMSIIGPRPLLPVDQPGSDTIRLAVRPGVTGWAQVHGGQLLSIEDKNALDEWYVLNAGVLVDLKILLLTFRTILFGDSWTASKLAQVLQPANNSSAPR